MSALQINKSPGFP